MGMWLLMNDDTENCRAEQGCGCEADNLCDPMGVCSADDGELHGVAFRPRLESGRCEYRRARGTCGPPGSVAATRRLCGRACRIRSCRGRRGEHRRPAPCFTQSGFPIATSMTDSLSASSSTATTIQSVGSGGVYTCPDNRDRAVRFFGKRECCRTDSLWATAPMPLDPGTSSRHCATRLSTSI